MLTNLPRLELVPVEKLVIHERHDDGRALPLIHRIEASGLFRNPPIVSPLQDGSGRFMVLDGANRTTALKEMGCPDAIVQVVQPDDPGLKLFTWNHVVWEYSSERFIEGFRRVEGVRLVESDEDDVEPALNADCGFAAVRSCTGELFEIFSEATELKTRIHLLNAVVDSYKSRARLDRTNERDVKALAEIYPQFSGLVIFPQFDVQDILELAGEGNLLPSGITRFTISPRALHLNYPLEELFTKKPLGEKNEALQKWIQERIAKKGVRYYTESTFLFDE